MDSSELEYVGFWLRLWATIIDSVLIMLILLPILWALAGHMYWLDFDALAGSGNNAFVIQIVLPVIAVIAFWVARQATPGKMAIGARIVDAETGRAPSTAQFIGRYFAYYVSLFPLCLGFVWVGLDTRKQGWHDKLAGTVVVRPKRGASSVHFRAA